MPVQTTEVHFVSVFNYYTWVVIIFFLFFHYVRMLILRFWSRPFDQGVTQINLLPRIFLKVLQSHVSHNKEILKYCQVSTVLKSRVIAAL